jgi:hypothetical protein
VVGKAPQENSPERPVTNKGVSKTTQKRLNAKSNEISSLFSEIAEKIG